MKRVSFELTDNQLFFWDDDDLDNWKFKFDEFNFSIKKSYNNIRINQVIHVK